MPSVPVSSTLRPLARAAAVALLAVLALALRPLGASADAVTDWNANAGKAALAACIAPLDDPLHESRMYAMSHAAIHDALNAIERRFRPYALRARSRPGASPEAAVAAAARTTLVSALRELPAAFPQSCRDAGVASVEADYTAALAAIPDGLAEARGVHIGQAAAATIIALRSGDGADTTFADTAYEEGDEPGEYRFTPGFPFYFAPGWADVDPWVLDESRQFRSGAPYAVRGRRYARDLEEIKRLGGDGVTTPTARTPEQTEIALFWHESSPLQWNRIARTLAAGAQLDPWAAARLFGLLNLALADGYIGSFESKRVHGFWRPVTAIRAAGADGNPRTTADPTWTPLRPTPPIPEQDSAHAVEGGAAAAVFAHVFGTDATTFATCSLTLPAGGRCGEDAAVARTFGSFAEAAMENAESRIFIGFHFRKAVEDGLEHGRRIGEWVTRHALRPRAGG